MLQDDELDWKLAVDYDEWEDQLILSINGRAFLTFAKKAYLSTPVPKNIEKGYIELNGIRVHSGYDQYEEALFLEWGKEHDIESVTEAVIGGKAGGAGFACSSSAALNSIFDDIGRFSDEEEGLKKLEINKFGDKNTLEEWPLSQLVAKSPNLAELKI